VGLREAIELGFIAGDLTAARYARTDDPKFPAPTGRRGAELLYQPAALRDWERTRKRRPRPAGRVRRSTFSFRLPEDVGRALEARAAKQHRSRPAVLIEALRVFLGPELAEFGAQSDQLAIQEEAPKDHAA